MTGQRRPTPFRTPAAPAADGAGRGCGLPDDAVRPESLTEVTGRPDVLPRSCAPGTETAFGRTVRTGAELRQGAGLMSARAAGPARLSPTFRAAPCVAPRRVDRDGGMGLYKEPGAGSREPGAAAACASGGRAGRPPCPAAQGGALRLISRPAPLRPPCILPLPAAAPEPSGAAGPPHAAAPPPAGPDRPEQPHHEVRADSTGYPSGALATLTPAGPDRQPAPPKILSARSALRLRLVRIRRVATGSGR